MPNIDDEIRRRVDAFVADLRTLINRAALETVSRALGAVAAGPEARPAPARPAPARRAARKRPPVRTAIAKPAVAKPAAARATPAPAPAGERPKGAKRPKAELARVQARLLGHIEAKPGQRIEQISAELRLPTKDLCLPARKLAAEGSILSRGVKRATTYWPR
ncbi:MAG: DNA-binding protein [Deltaproteobacteria bacterium]|nr:DNA-binding protein [Deltaproteobacteria bacterium]